MLCTFQPGSRPDGYLVKFGKIFAKEGYLVLFDRILAKDGSCKILQDE